MTAATIAIVVAHPDDEVLGFGGTIARHADGGDAVRILCLATGLAARDADNAPDAGALEALREQARSAAEVLGAAGIAFAEFPDNRMDSVALLDIVKRVEAFLRETGASRVYTHHAGDLNIDHRICAQAVLTACRPLPGATVRRILAGEVQSSSEYTTPKERFQPASYVDISAQLDRKCAALACYRDELRDWPHPRSLKAVRHLAHLRGSEAGLEAAEAFVLLREIIA